MNENKNTPLEQDREALVQKAVFTFIATDKLHRRAIERWASDAGMHSSQHRMLIHLSCCEHTPSQKEIAEHFDISPAAVAGTLKKLEADGYIERGKCSCRQDSRFNEVKITERGREAILQSRKYFRHVDNEAMRGFSAEELDTFMGFLERMQENLKSCEPIDSHEIPEERTDNK